MEPLFLRVFLTEKVDTALGQVTLESLTPAAVAPLVRLGRAVCHICGRRLGSQNKLKAHLNSHLGQRPFRCDLCDKGFFRNSNLQAHRRTHFPPQLACPWCSLSFSRSSDRLAHVLLRVCQRPPLRRTHQGLLCDACGRSVPSEAHRCPKKERRCPVCQLDFQGQRDHAVVSHVRREHPEYAQAWQ